MTLEKLQIGRGLPPPLAQSPEELQELYRMCREGRVYDVEKWIDEGKSLQLAPGVNLKGRPRPDTALEIALGTGQHSLSFLLLRSGYRLELEPDSPLNSVLENRRWDLFELLLEWGADLKRTDPHFIIRTYRTDLYERYYAAGYDLTSAHEMADMLGQSASNRPLYGFAKRHRTEDPRIQRELDMALCEQVREGNAKGISLCLWAGANPHAQVPNLNYMFYDEDDEETGWSAIEEAVCAGDAALLKKFCPDPTVDDFDELYRYAKSESVIEFLAKISPPQDVTAILQCQIYYLTNRFLRLGGGIGTIEAILTCGIIWQELDSGKIGDIRRSLLKAYDYDFRRLMRLFGRSEICARETYEELIRTPTMQKRLLALNIIRPKIPERQRRREEQARLACQYDREKLYEQVWAEPVQRVAKLYGISDVRLGKVCRILNVPTPPRGYWARIRCGQKVRRSKLPKMEVSRD